MERQICESCGARQPPEWRAGDLCGSCGAAVRLELRCPWCAEWSPAGRFCRGCGCELPEARLYGAARLLKDAGIDRFALLPRLRAMDGEQVADLTRRFEEQRAVALRRVEEVRLCERWLLGRGHADALEERLVASLPLDKAALAELGAGPKPPFDDPSRLPDVFRDSPLQDTRTLAAAALIRLRRDDREVLRRARDASAEDSAPGREAALALAHWRFHWAPDRAEVEVERLAARAEPCLADGRLRPWAAVARDLWLRRAAQHRERARPELVAAFDAVQEQLRLGLADQDPDLRLSCALALGHEPTLRPFLDAQDEGARAAARDVLAVRGLAPDLVIDEATKLLDDEAGRLLERLPLPLDATRLDHLFDTVRPRPRPLRVRLGRRFRSCPFWRWEPDARAALVAFVTSDKGWSGDARELLDWLGWAATPESSGWPPSPPRLEGPVLELALAASDALARRAPGMRQAVVGCHGFNEWLWSAVTPRAQAALDAYALDATDGAGRALFDRMASLEAQAERFGGGGFPTGLALLRGIWERTPRADLPTLARNVGAGWSLGYAHDGAALRAFVEARYRDREDERACLRAAFPQLPARDGRGWDEEHRLLAGEGPRGGPEPVACFLELCALQPDRTYDHVEWVMEGMEPRHLRALAEALLDERRRSLASGLVSDTQLLPPMVAFARRLAAVPPGALDGDALRATLDPFRRGWLELTAGRRSLEPTESYYEKEKLEELQELFARVEELIRGAAAPDPTA